jgi:hypothetical protein
MRRMALDTQTQLFKNHYNLCRKRGALNGQMPDRSAGLTIRLGMPGELLTCGAAVISRIT